MDGFRLKCETCGESYTIKSDIDTMTGTIDLNKNKIPYQKEIWFGNYPNLCENCKSDKKIEKRNKTIENIIKKKWWQF